MHLKDKEILITGGTGSLGKVLTQILAHKYKPRGIRIFSRDEFKHWDMQNKTKHWDYQNISYIIGDVRNYSSVKRAMKGCNIVIHTAAMKQIPACEVNPIEAETINIGGAKNIIQAALENESVEKVMNISTDKACYPINFYGMTKAAAERLFIEGNIYSEGKSRRPKFASCRYGNILGSRGSVIQLFRDQAKTGKITITDPNMTRFWITISNVANFIIRNIGCMESGEVFVPDIPSCSMQEFADIVAPNCESTIIGIRKGEKKHENIITKEESIISEYFNFNCGAIRGGWCIKEGNLSAEFILTSDNNLYKLDATLLNSMLSEDEITRGEKWKI